MLHHHHHHHHHHHNHNHYHHHHRHHHHRHLHRNFLLPLSQRRASLPLRRQRQGREGLRSRRRWWWQRYRMTKRAKRRKHFGTVTEGLSRCWQTEVLEQRRRNRRRGEMAKRRRKVRVRRQWQRHRLSLSCAASASVTYTTSLAPHTTRPSPACCTTASIASRIDFGAVTNCY
jgi:hypothetical protein